MSLFDSCKLNSSFDEMFNPDCTVREHWKNIVNNLEQAPSGLLEQKQTEIDWRLEDNGVTYNIYNDPTGNNRRWNLDPIPFVLKEQEWDEVSRGLQQRAKLLNLIFKDLYTDQKLIKEGILPAEIIYAHKGFLTEVSHFDDAYYKLHFYAADISRGPDGKFWVINDRTQSPSGLGYAIENRLTMNSVSNDLYPDIEIKKIVHFVENYKSMLKNITPKHIHNPLIALLTPGPFNETYFEHSYLSSFLDLTLVQGEDLLVKNSSVWIKSLSGLKKVDGILRRVDGRFCDPLELRNDSRLGVAGLVDVARNNNVALVNPLGIGILENLGLNPFMENIAKYFLNEELILPQIATWWCGQEKELEFVIQSMDTLIIKKIDRTKNIETYFGKYLNPSAKAELIAKMRKYPHLYVGQEQIDFSTVPSYVNGKIEPRNAVIRAFSFQNENNFEVMPGGLVRISSSKDSLVVSNQKGGSSKDLWILGKSEDISHLNIFKSIDSIDTRLEHISTKRAENLFWLGRYLTRAIITARMIRFLLKNIINFNRYETSHNSNEVQTILNIALTHLTMTYPGFLDEKEKQPLGEILSVITDKTRVGTLSFTLDMLSSVSLNVKHLMTLEAWRILEKIKKEWYFYLIKKAKTNREHINELDKVLIYLMAYKELIDESIFKEQGLILYDIGYKLEISLLLISKLRSLLTAKFDKLTEYDILDSMLHSYESYNSYRAYYKSTLQLDNVLEFLLFNTKYPKSLIYIILELLEDLKELPKMGEETHLSSYEEPIFNIYSMLRLNSAATLLQSNHDEFIYQKLDEFLATISNHLIESSNELTKTYFAHYNE